MIFYPFANFSQDLSYIDALVDNGFISESQRQDNVKMFSVFCADFYVVEDHGSIRECSYSNATKGAEGCERVRNVQEEKNHRFKNFILASIAIVCVKEFLKLLLVLFVWLFAASRELHIIELVFVGESPFQLLLLWRRPRFLQELLLTSKTWKSHLLVFFVEDFLESVNQLALVVYFALRVDQQGISIGIMISMALSVLKMMKTGYSAISAWQKERGAKTARVHVDGDGAQGST